MPADGKLEPVATDLSTEDADLSSPGRAADSLEALLKGVVEAPATYTTLAKGTVVAKRYVVERVLGAGGFGTVYLARDRQLERHVALKLHRTSAASERLHREAVAMAKLSHPHVVAVYEIGELDGRPFVAMEYIAGTNLRAWLTVPRSRRAILEALLAAGEGLAAAHDAGLVHRDVKPDNIFVGVDGRVRIGDFGLARAQVASPGGSASVDANAQTVTTATGTIAGTPAYMAPEQIAGGELDARTDQFAFCVAAWEALCGDRPYAGETTDKIYAAIEAGEAPRVKRDVPARIRRVLLRGLALDPAARWPSLRALLAALRSAERRPRVIAAIAGGAVAAGVALAWYLWPAPDPREACDTAGAEVDVVLPVTLADQAIATVRRGNEPNADVEIGFIKNSLDHSRTSYRALVKAQCNVRVTGQWSPKLVQAGAQCAAYDAANIRALYAAATTAGSQPSDVVQVIAKGPQFLRCADPTLLAGWRPLAGDPEQLDAVIAARAQLDAAATLVSLGQLRAARAAHAAVAASPVRTDPAIVLRLALVRAKLLIVDGDLAAAQPLLEDTVLQARAQNDPAITLAALHDLVDLVGRARRDFQGATRWIREGLSEAERAQLIEPSAGFELLVAAAMLLDDAGDSAQALDLAAKAEVFAVKAPVGRRLDLLAVRANAYAGLGKTREALDQVTQLVTGLRGLFGANHPRVAQALALRASILVDAGDTAQAVAAASEAVAILDKVKSDESEVIATAEMNLGVTLIHANEPGAGEHLTRARALLVKIRGAESSDVALLDTNLALVYMDRGDSATAIPMLEHATAVQERVLGPEHEELAAGLYNLAVAQRQAGKLDLAAATATRCATIYQKHQPGSTRHATALHHLAFIENLRGHFEQALTAAMAAMKLPGADEDQQAGAHARLEAARALIGLHRDPAQRRKFLLDARTRFEMLNMTARVAEVDKLLANGVSPTIH